MDLGGEFGTGKAWTKRYEEDVEKRFRDLWGSCHCSTRTQKKQCHDLHKTSKGFSTRIFENCVDLSALFCYFSRILTLALSTKIC